jgi:pimeloyl-ACP methyl ester carboxylesterase
MKKALIVLALIVASLAVSAPSDAKIRRTAALTQTTIPVVLIHGYNNSLCDGVNVASYWQGATTELTQYAGVPAENIYPVSYYKCDTNGFDASGYGSGVDYPLTKTSGIVKARALYTSDTSIVQLAHDMAWFLYYEFTVNGQPVYVVAHSMGGVVIREAMRRVAAGDPDFPSALDVPKIMTISSPHAGVVGGPCGNTANSVECAEMVPGSSFITDLQTDPAPQGSTGTAWWAMASSGKNVLGQPCDFVPTDTATDITATVLVYSKPCYNHNAYLSDTSQTQDATLNDVTNSPRSLAMVGEVVGNGP